MSQDVFSACLHRCGGAGTSCEDAFHSQRGQDQWVLSTFAPSPRPARSARRFVHEPGLSSSRQRRGRSSFYYVDMGAQTPGCLSNTWALERRGWAGLCIEASPEYATQLRQARTCTVVEAAIDSHERNTTFLLAGGYGGLVGRGLDNFRRHPKGTGPAPPAFNVTTRRFVDVLAAAKAPRTISYMSVDVEGAEGRVLTPAVLSRHTILTLTVERPSPSLVALLFAHDYLFVKTVDFDGHFVHATHPQARELERNASFAHIPAKCTPHSPTRIGWLYSLSRGAYPNRCNNAGYYTLYSEQTRFRGNCCYHRCGAGDCTHLRYGPPTTG
jgi:FkbM family methyltransferase